LLCKKSHLPTSQSDAAMGLSSLRELLGSLVSLVNDEVIEEGELLVFDVPACCPVQVPLLELMLVGIVLVSSQTTSHRLEGAHMCTALGALLASSVLSTSAIESSLLLGPLLLAHVCARFSQRTAPQRKGDRVGSQHQLPARVGKACGSSQLGLRLNGGLAPRTHLRLGASDNGVCEKKNATLSKKVAALESLAGRFRPACHTRSGSSSTAHAALGSPGVGIALDPPDTSMYPSTSQKAALTPDLRCKRDDQSHAHRVKEPIRRFTTDVCTSKPCFDHSPASTRDYCSSERKSVGTKKSTSPQIISTPLVKTGVSSRISVGGFNSQSSTPSDIVGSRRIGSDSSSCSDEEDTAAPCQDQWQNTDIVRRKRGPEAGGPADKADAEVSHTTVMQSLQKRRSVLAALREPWQHGDVDGLTDALCSIRVNGCTVLKEFLPRSRYNFGTRAVRRKFTSQQAEQLQTSLQSFLLTL